MIPFWLSDEEKVIRLRNEHEYRLYEVNKFSFLLNTYAAEYGIFECIKKQNAMFRKLSRLDARYEFLVKKINKRIDTNIRRKNEMIEEYVNKKLIQRNAANQHLLETLGVTMENLEEHEIAVNEEGEIVRVQRVMKATIWEKKQDAT